MSLSQPTPPDPGLTATIQQTLNDEALTKVAGMEQVNVNNPFGTTNWEGVGGANPTQTQALSPAMQRIFGTARTLGTNANPQYTAPQNFTDLANPLIEQQMAALAPIFRNERSNLDSKLQNQGLAQGSQAWNNAQRGQTAGEAQAIAAYTPQAIQLAMQNYEMPIQTQGELYALASGKQPQSPIPQNFQQMPANYAGLAEQNYQAQQGQFNNTMQGISNLGSAAVGGLFGLKNPGGGSWLVG